MSRQVGLVFILISELRQESFELLSVFSNKSLLFLINNFFFSAFDLSLSGEKFLFFSFFLLVNRQAFLPLALDFLFVFQLFLFSLFHVPTFLLFISSELFHHALSKSAFHGQFFFLLTAFKLMSLHLGVLELVLYLLAFFLLSNLFLTFTLLELSLVEFLTQIGQFCFFSATTLILFIKLLENRVFLGVLGVFFFFNLVG